MFGALIGAGASLLGGLFGGKSKKQETTTTSHVDYGRMVREAEAAGFNPLTALRNGGAAGFSVSTGTTPATPLSARIADGVSGAAQTFLANFDPFKDQQRETEFKLVEAQLANLNADTALKQRTGLGSVPTYTVGNTKRTMGAGVGHNQKFKSVSDVVPKPVDKPKLSSLAAETEVPKRTNPYPTWLNAEVNPWQPDASAWEDHLGDNEVSSMVGTVLQLGQDWVWNGYRTGRWLRDGVIRPAIKSHGKSLRDNYHPTGTNIYGLPAGQIPSLSSPRKYKQ